MSDEAAVDDGPNLDPDLGTDRTRRRRAVLYVAPFLALGLADVLLLLWWGINPLWGFMILPPILFCSALAYLAFSTDFLDDRT
ncbi:hypothetical protein [Halobaculum sp. MBLA0143]|uniref:hypothetical protein n=1 Tax=Halobaculum sp. MBLA0143 TaxID=3079933 RepID=UPI003524AF3F